MIATQTNQAEPSYEVRLVRSNEATEGYKDGFADGYSRAWAECWEHMRQIAQNEINSPITTISEDK